MVAVDLSERITRAVHALGVLETAKRLQMQPGTALRLAIGDRRVRKGSVALALANIHKLSELES